RRPPPQLPGDPRAVVGGRASPRGHPPLSAGTGQQESVRSAASCGAVPRPIHGRRGREQPALAPLTGWDPQPRALRRGGGAAIWPMVTALGRGTVAVDRYRVAVALRGPDGAVVRLSA